MIPSDKTIVILCLDDDVPGHTLTTVLERLGVDSTPDRRVRFHDSGLFTCRLDRAPDPELLQTLERLPGVARLQAVPAGGRIAGRRPDGTRSRVTLAGGVTFGAGDLTVIAGPCSVESVDQVCSIASQVKQAGASALRGGAFKPRTSPYSFGGLGEDGLKALARAREKTGLPVVTEVLDTADIDLVAQYADAFQIGSRNMFNFPLLFKVGRHPSRKPVLLKRGFAATIDEFLEAAEYIVLGQLVAGHEEPAVILCERGIRTFETSTRFTLDVGAIPVLRDRSRFPVVADPSHPAGARRYVQALGRAAVAAGADGLLVEVHFAPAEAWCDGEQSLNPAEFYQLMQDARQIASIVRPVKASEVSASVGMAMAC